MPTLSPQRAAPPAIRIGAPPQPPRTRSPRRLPSWGLKTAMAVSGIVLAMFVGIHLFGNLKVYQSAASFNGYATWLREAFYPLVPQGMVLWTVRIVLSIAGIVHVVAAALIWIRGRRARGGHRVRLRGFQAWSAWLMPVTGVLVLIFVGYHLLDLTIGLTPAATAEFVHPHGGEMAAYENLVASFQRPVAAALYTAMMLVLSLHVAKGFGTLAVDLGVMGRRLRATLAAIGGLLALAIVLGNGGIPIAVQAGWLS